jgi:hypothetical protein
MILRPGDLRDFDVQPERRMPTADTSVRRPTTDWIAGYDRMPASEAKQRCLNDSNFNALVDELYARRNPQGGQQQ